MRASATCADAARGRLVAAGIPDAEAALDAELLLRHVLGWDRATVADPPRRAGSGGRRPTAFDGGRRRGGPRASPWRTSAACRSSTAAPSQVGPGVLIPRPETELARRGRRWRRWREPPAPRVARHRHGQRLPGRDAGARAARARSVVATDVSARPWRCARSNADGTAWRRASTFVQTAFLDGVAGPFDLDRRESTRTCATPIARSLAPEVRRYEPARGAVRRRRRPATTCGSSSALAATRARAAAARWSWRLAPGQWPRRRAALARRRDSPTRACATICRASRAWSSPRREEPAAAVAASRASVIERSSGSG